MFTVLPITVRKAALYAPITNVASKAEASADRSKSGVTAHSAVADDSRPAAYIDFP